VYSTTGGLEADSANLLFNGTTLTANTLNLTNALTTAYGGTGLTTFTAGDLPYYASGTALSKLGIGTAGQVLTSTGTAPQWSTLSGVAVTTFSAGTTGFTPSSATSGAVTLAGTLATTNGGTGLISFTSGGAVYATSTSALTTGTLPTTAGGTGLTSFTANGVVYASSSSALTTGSALVFDGTNLGLGVAPSAWNSVFKAIQVNAQGSLMATSASMQMGNNIYYDAGAAFRFIGTGYAKRYYQSVGQHVWTVSTASGTAGGAVTETQAMTLDASGNLGIGTTSPAAATRLTLDYPGFVSMLLRSSGTDRIALYGDAAVSAVDGKANPLAFYAGSAERMRLDASGNLGIGTTSPSTYGKIVSSGGTFSLVTDTATQRRLSFWSTSNGNSENAYIQVQNDGATTNTGEMLFATRNSGGTLAERMRLNASGVFFVGATAITSDANYFAYDPGNTFADFGHATGVASGVSYTRFLYGGGVIGSITQSGTTAVLYNVTSDQRLKENIVDAPEFGGVIDSIKVRSYDWKSDGNHQRAGFVAQELVTVAPEAVHQPADPDEMMAVDYSKLVPMLVKEIQSLRIRIAQLEAK
jgi:hypothetical protein